MAVTRRDYGKDLSEAAKGVMIELAHVLGEYKENIVLVGGWVPELLISTPEIPHVGSIDVDIVLDHREIDESGYQMILDLLEENGYSQSNVQPFIFYKMVKIGGKDHQVEVDFLAGEYDGTRKNKRTQIVQDLRPRKARGADLVFELNTTITIEGKLPSGAVDRVSLKVAAVPAFLVMKGLALRDRKKEKDAYDIYFTVRNYPGGIKALAEEFKDLLDTKLVQEGLMCIHDGFRSVDHTGPQWVADFEGFPRGEERDMAARDAFERINALLRNLGVY